LFVGESLDAVGSLDSCKTLCDLDQAGKPFGGMEEDGVRRGLRIIPK
jgi:hypothetical protein